ncbi:MAG: exonuclease SbcCD subunit D [Lachnospiraceae bacterium]|nr:exonuclease SbcCD subunit D [Lachnospiraceae bacterium]
MRLLHTSDWHLGASYTGEVDCSEDIKNVIGEILDIAQTRKADGIMIAGDVFDKGIPAQSAIRLYDDIVTHICRDMKMPLFMIAGNHDGADRLSQCNALLKSSGLYIAGSLKTTPYVESIGDADIYMLPWISTDKVRSIYPDMAEEINTMEDAFETVLNDYRAHFREGRKNILLAHAFAVNAETSVSDRAAVVGRATMVGAYVFRDFDYVALGHIHGPQWITDRIRYCGSPICLSFGNEEKQVKSVTIYDTESGEAEIIPLSSGRRLHTIRGKYHDIISADYPNEIKDSYIRLEITDIYISPDTYTSLKGIFPHLLEVSGRDYEYDNGSITMTIEELYRSETEPKLVFEHFCRDIIGDEPDDHLVELFDRALEACAKEGEGS